MCLFFLACSLLHSHSLSLFLFWFRLSFFLCVTYVKKKTHNNNSDKETTSSLVIETSLDFENVVVIENGNSSLKLYSEKVMRWAQTQNIVVMFLLLFTFSLTPIITRFKSIHSTFALTSFIWLMFGLLFFFWLCRLRRRRFFLLSFIDFFQQE